MKAPRWLPAAAAALFATGFAWLNRGERIAIDVGVTTFYQVPLATVLLGVFLAGMLAMLLLGLPHDRRVRDQLRRHGLLQPREPAVHAASAWGVTREPAPARDEPAAERHDGPADHAQAHGPHDPAAADPPHDDSADRAVAHLRHDGPPDRTVAYSGYDEAGADRTAAYPRHDEAPISERTGALPRYDEGPVA